ncbi:MAG: hypothetical protein HYY68_02875 [Thaumarchaeota archaeon]|nr:hypothetical protein [Nitrososphaerota archaeon]
MSSEDPSPLVTIAGWVVVTAFLALIASTTAPFGAFLGDTQYAVVSTVHGMLATLGVIIGTVATYLGWRLFTGKIRAFTDLRILSVLSALIATGTVLFGNWIYVAYRATGGPREFFLKNNPEIHEIFFEFKEFIALFTIPLSIAAAFIIWRYKDQVIGDRPLRTWVFIAIMIAWTALMIAFLLGAGITKVRSV